MIKVFLYKLIYKKLKNIMINISNKNLPKNLKIFIKIKSSKIYYYIYFYLIKQLNIGRNI